MKILKSLTKQIVELKAGDGHIQMNNIEKTQGLTAVISVYDSQKPAHKVLDELYDWAQMNDSELAMRIEMLEADMSWNSDEE